MKRYEHAFTIMNPAPIVDVPPLGIRDEWDDSVTDKSFFIPMAESVKTVNATPFSEAEIAASFDFKDGKDSGDKIPVDRYRGLDLAEVSQIERNLRSKLEKQAKDDKAKAEMKADIEKIYTKPSVPTPSPTPAT
ncbi:hypothetical protein [Tortoise microvirus 63]|nr:hypothetical protein [Tortoise microvirus 63]